MLRAARNLDNAGVRHVRTSTFAEVGVIRGTDQRLIGRVLAIAGSQMTIDGNEVDQSSVRVGSLVKVINGDRDVVGSVSEMKADRSAELGHLLVVDLLGEVYSANGRGRQFSLGVSSHPVPGEPVVLTNDADMRAIYGEPSQSNVRVGTLYRDATHPAYVLTDELLGKHFAILGTTGSGKSCALTVILSAILDSHRKAHVILLDPHDEYGAAFGDFADIINADNLQLPLWMLNFEEAARILIRGGSDSEQESQALILNDAITWARRNYDRNDRSKPAISVDTPVPFRVYDLVRFLNDEMGRLTKPDTAIPYLRLRGRIESLRSDRRLEFLFASEADILEDVIGRLLRIPVQGKPLTIIDLSGVPSDVADVIVSTLSRVLFDFAVWCERECMPPILLVCEEAHRYVPADERLGFAQTVRGITQIAKEGRKYGISLALITQRPSELLLAALSQCGTVFALRLGSDRTSNSSRAPCPTSRAACFRHFPACRTNRRSFRAKASAFRCAFASTICPCAGDRIAKARSSRRPGKTRRPITASSSAAYAAGADRSGVRAAYWQRCEPKNSRSHDCHNVSPLRRACSAAASRATPAGSSAAMRKSAPCRCGSGKVCSTTTTSPRSRSACTCGSTAAIATPSAPAISVTNSALASRSAKTPSNRASSDVVIAYHSLA